MVTSRVRGQFVWHELRTRDAAKARDFYGQAVGWRTEPWTAQPDYPLFLAPSGAVGGAVEAGGTPVWVPYISTADVDATVEAATRLGGRVETPPTALPNGNRYAVLIDPEGAVFGIHASTTEPPSSPSVGPGEFAWHELATTVAPGIAFGFYGALFDWDEIAEHDMGPMGLYLIFGRSGKQMGGMFDKGAGRPGPAYWLGYVSVVDLAGAVERAQGAEASVVVPPMEVPGGDRIAALKDPEGALFALHSPAAQAEEPVKPAATAPTAPSAPAKRRKKAKRKTRPRKRSARRTATRKPAKRAKKQRAAGRTAKRRPAKRKLAKTAAKKRATRRTTKPKPVKRKTKTRRRR